ncbi:MAG: leucine-rich repeat domain-containing protein [Clostridia bacterium]|nr:leucine-rich repeat domain-containing protein [Clostridia bacterium]
MLFLQNTQTEIPDGNTPQQAARIDRAIRVLTVVVILLAIAFLAYMIGARAVLPSANYKKGMTAMKAGDYAAAIEAFGAAGDYQDASDQLALAKKQYADLLAGKSDAVSYTTKASPWFSMDGQGEISFSQNTYADYSSRLPQADRLIVPDVLDLCAVTAIKESTFLNADTLVSITLPDRVLTIPDGCFNHCDRLEEVLFSDALVSIEQRAFIHCAALKQITLPETLTALGLRAFNNCYALETVVIGGAQLKTIEPYTFAECRSLSEITLPASVSSIGEGAFAGCGALGTVYFGGDAEAWSQITVAEGNEALLAAEIVYVQ